MPLDCLLFFGGNGCGDYYGYPITSQDGVRDDNVFIWEHEYDNRIWKANNLEDAIKNTTTTKYNASLLIRFCLIGLL
jgi:hypothetical protein